MIEGDNSFINIVRTKKWTKRPSSTVLYNYNKGLTDTLSMLYERDQHFRRMPNSYKIYGDTIKSIDKQNDLILLSIIKKYGYPSEKIIGLSEGIRIGHNFEMVIWHQTTINRISDYTDILIDAAKSGKIVPQRAAALIENHNGDERYAMWLYYEISCETCSDSIQKMLNNRLFYSEISEKMTKKYDLERYSIGLESLKDYEKKILFCVRNQRFKLFSDRNIPIINFKTDNEVSGFIEPMKYIDK